MLPLLLLFLRSATALGLGEPLDLLNVVGEPPRAGLPSSWSVTAMRGQRAPAYSLEQEEGEPFLRISGEGRAAWATRAIAPALTEPAGELRWSWRVLVRPDSADLRQSRTDDSALRIFVVFGTRPGPFGGSGRVLFYSWGTREPEGYSARSFPTARAHVMRMAGDAQLDARWHDVTVHPFEDFHRIWGSAPPPITAVGVLQDTDATHQRAIADLRRLEWLAPHLSMPPAPEAP